VLSTVALHLAYVAAGLVAVLARPVLRRVAPGSPLAELVAPAGRLAGWFLPVVTFYAWSTFVNRSLGDHWQRWLGPFGYGDHAYLRAVDQELPELLFATGILLALLATARKLRAYAPPSGVVPADPPPARVPAPGSPRSAASSPSTRSSHSTALG
jgi:hypothetical protein